ncbi:tripartite tricarboxylate transporter TctB family protein [Hydrogenophaga palleronii]|uniref:tripartite tricarboxylate transporter TctB family protein n=1 Tax=Hydrogenophaga palleronii TaxID=65655 RepID=UPI000824EE7B|nr:tripartite tricarboxylate transporter TctB family protein [Hydrogenophaga palleronii]
MIKNLQDCLTGLLFLALGVGFGWAASRHSLGSAADMGPGYVPLLLGLLLGLLGICILFKALTFEALGGGRVRHWGFGPLLRLLAGLFWLALCSGPAQWPWIGPWFQGWPTFGLVAGVAGLLLAVVPGTPGGTPARVWLWSIGLALLVLVLWVGPLDLDLPLWPTRAGN